MISFRIDWFDLLAVQGTLRSLLQHHSSKASILQRSVFLMVQLTALLWVPGMHLIFLLDSGHGGFKIFWNFPSGRGRRLSGEELML